MILTYSSRSTAAPTHARRPASQGALARGDRGSILGASVVNGKPFRPMVTEAAVMLPLNVNGDGCPEPATPAFRIASRSDVSTLNPFAKGTPCRSTQSMVAGISDGGDNRVATPLAAVTPNLAPNPRSGLLAVINDTETTMQVDSRAVAIAQDANDAKKLAIRIFSRDGVIDDEEFELLNGLNSIERSLEEKAEDELLGQAIVKLGRNSQRVKRLSRQIFPTDPEAA